MTLVTIRDFLHITRLRSEALLSMLENGELTTSTGVSGELLIDISRLKPENLARRKAQTKSPREEDLRRLSEEMIASQIIEEMEPVLDEALDLALKWLSEKHRIRHS